MELTQLDLDSLKQQLEELEERFQQWIEPIERVHMISLHKVNKAGYTLNNHQREVREIAQSQIARYNPYQEMYAVLDQLCPIYLSANPQERADIRLAVRSKEGIWSGLINYAYRAADRLHFPADEEWLRLGLTAISIEDCSCDYRDTLWALAELCVAAEKASMDPEPYFREVAELSSHQTSSGSGKWSFSEMLLDFQRIGGGVIDERRNQPEGHGMKEEAPWKRRIYHFERASQYLEEAGLNERIHSRKRIFDLD